MGFTFPSRLLSHNNEITAPTEPAPEQRELDLVFSKPSFKYSVISSLKQKNPLLTPSMRVRVRLDISGEMRKMLFE